jgi:hypothetical protein
VMHVREQEPAACLLEHNEAENRGLL